MEEKVILVRYGELFLKSGYVREQMLNTLKTNIENALNKRVRRTAGRIIVDVIDKKTKKILAMTFGVVSFSEAFSVDKNINEIEKISVEIMKGVPKTKTFAIKASRSDKNFLTSKEIENKIGQSIVDLGYKVNLNKPDKKIYIEIRDMAYVYDKKEPGPGGMPLGTSGFAVSKLKSEKDFVACWLAMKRGTIVVPTEYDKKLYSLLERWAVGRKIRIPKNKAAIAEVISVSRPEDMPNGFVLAPLIGFIEKEVNDLVSKIS